MNMMQISRICGYLLSLTVLVPSQNANAHPFHISTAEMEYNAKTGRFEVSLKLHAIDLERAISGLAGKKVDIENEGVESLLQSYLGRHFYMLTLDEAKRQAKTKKPIRQNRTQQEKVANGGLQRSELTFIGKELETSWIWLYFEVAPPKSELQLALVNSVLLDTTDRQVNTVSIRYAAKRRALKMDAEKPWAEFSEEWFRPSKQEMTVTPAADGL